MTNKDLVLNLCRRERGKKQVNVAQMTEIVSNLSDIVFVMPKLMLYNLLHELTQLGEVRAKKSKNKKPEKPKKPCPITINLGEQVYLTRENGIRPSRMAMPYQEKEMRALGKFLVDASKYIKSKKRKSRRCSKTKGR